ncbi:MAG: response regulator [Paenibacillaceae bacterium]|nr:response regulator [Paenibacillaceae bacterium]
MYKVFLVEDEAMIRRGIKKLIEEVIRGYTVVGEAANGREAIEKLAGQQPDLLVTDIRMNEMGGLELIEHIRRHHAEMPILIISGYHDFVFLQKALRFHVADYLLKPIDRIELAQALERIRLKLESGRPSAAQGNPVAEERLIIKEIKHVIRERLDQELSLQVVAEHVHLNHQYLSTLFKMETGQNFYDYIVECRMNRAKQLLKETNLKIYEVAGMSGYVSAKHFMAVFKQTVGMTPTEYREGG